MKNKMNIYEKGLEEYPKEGIILGNFMMILWIALGTIACWFLHPLIAWIYLAFAIIMVFIVLRKLVCINCYYYDKWCSIGWGKLSALFFKKGDIEKFGTSFGIKIAPFVYGSLTLIPLIALIISIIKGFSFYKVAVLVFLLFIGFYSGTISRKKVCAKCKMRLICPGSAVNEAK